MKKNIAKRLIAFCLAIALVATFIPGSLFGLVASANTDSAFERVSDNESIDYWKGYFSDGVYDSNVWSDTISTINAGAVWTDKSVFVPSSSGYITIDGVNVPLVDTEDNFLVSMSVMASNKTVKGYEYIPTSTMLVLDVSASMGNGNNGNKSWDEMVEAANKAIHRPLNLNNNNLVGVVLYSGNTSSGSSDIGHSSLLLPLNRYTTTATNNAGTRWDTSDDYPEYLTASDSKVGISSAVTPATSGSKNVSGGTYIQGGIYRAMEELIASDSPKEVSEGVQAGMAYTPIVVLMSDGAPTAGNLDYNFSDDSDNHETDIGNGTATNERIGFVTQLTAAYAKAKIDEVYEKDTLFYTLGLGLNSLNDTSEAIAEAVLNPKENNGNMNTYWDTYLNLANNATMYLRSEQNRGQTKYYEPVVKSGYVTESYKNYVTQYFEAIQTNNVSLEQSLLNAFEQIVDAIVLQSVYYPTEISGGSADLGGYVTFRDELGEYMDVINVKGFLFEDENGHQILHTGSALAKNFVEGGGELGQTSNPKPLGDEFVRAVKTRLDISDTLTAQNLIRNAYYYKQLMYENENNFSNYIGWYGDENGNFVDFWHDGHTDTEKAVAIANGAKFIYKSYCYLGEVNEDLGIKASDMMYTVIRVRETIASDVAGTAVGEIVVEGTIPASLIPTITYEVTLEGKTYESGIKDLKITDTSADFPARILYEVALREDINEINIAEKVNANHKNQDGTYTFYTNDWAFVDVDSGAIADTSINAFTHFEPSNENERYYYLTDSKVYIDDNGTPYTGTAKPSGSGYYHSERIFEKNNGTVSTKIVYSKSSPDAIEHAEKQGNEWFIVGGTGKHEIIGDKTTLKDNNNTATNKFISYPKIKTNAENPTGEHSAHYSVVTFGNNGKLTVTPATGIKLTKTLDSNDSSNQRFEFKISGANANEQYKLTPLNADGSFGETATVKADSNGVITVNLLAGETVYVTGLDAGTYTVTESDHATYRVLTINGQATETNSTLVTVVSQKTSEVSFQNTLKGFGNLYITKEVVSGLEGHSLPAHALITEFDITVDLGADYKGEKNLAAAHSGDTSLTTVTVGNDGKITGLKIKHGETIVIRNLPENTTAVVTEAQSNNYTDSYSSHNKTGETMDNDSTVTILKDANATVIVKNTYKPTETNLQIGFEGKKEMDATHLQSSEEFKFILEKYDDATRNWTPVSGFNASVEIEAGTNYTGSAAKDINFNNFSLNLNFTSPGVHTYRIYEEPNGNAEITFDPAIYTFVITVTDTDGQLTAKVTGSTVSQSGSDYIINANFKNAYHTAPVIIDVQKIVEDNTKAEVSFAGYEFELYEANSSWNYSAADLKESRITDANGKARFSWLVDSGDIGKTYYYVLKEKVPAGYVKGAYGWDYDTTEKRITVKVDSDNSNITVQIDENAVNHSATYEFTNKYTAKEAEVEVEATKTLTGRDMEANEFTFTVQDENGKVIAVGFNAAAEDSQSAEIAFYVADESGNATNVPFKLTYNKEGIHRYKISEVKGDTTKGVEFTDRIFDLVVEVTDDGNGSLVANYYYEDSTSTVINFENSYSIKTPTSISLEATKRLTGDRHMLFSEFHFNIFEMTDSTFETKKSETAVATGANIGAVPNAGGVAESIFKFSPIEYTAAGVYYYQISEEKQNNDLGITYDDKVYNVTVTVADNLDGTLTAKADMDSDDIVFTNKYTPRSTSKGFAASKELEGRTLDGNEFEFAIFNATVNIVDNKEVWTKGAQVGENVKNAANGDIVFPEITFTEKGTYRYIVKEIDGGKGGVTYDETEFYVTFKVTDDHKGNLSVETVITDDEGNLSQIVFNNEYTTDNTQIVIEATKTLVGRDMEVGEFEFVIKDGDKIVAKGTNKAAKDAVAADIEFEAIEYTLNDVGEHIYTLEEVRPDGNFKDGVAYDDTVITIKVEVKDNRDGTLTASVDKAKNELEFTNTYSAENVEIDLSKTAKKELDGRVLNDEEFTFELYEAEETAENGIVIGDKIQSAKNDKNGKFVFNKITYTQTGTYLYAVKEVKGDKGGVIYDETVYYVVVEVKDNLLGKLEAEVTIKTSEGEKADALIFKNAYEVTDAGIAVKGEKKLSGATLADKQFTFELFEANEKFEIVGNAVKTAKNAKDGSIVFEELKFTKAGTYRYVILEKNDAQEGYIYDDTVWCVTVEVKDNGEGALVAEKTITKKGESEEKSEFIFENKYDEPKTPEIPELPENPGTGVNANILLWMILMLISGGLIGAAALSKKRRKA